MTDNKFNRYLWLLNTIRSFGPITFEDIDRRWQDSTMNEYGCSMPKKTFHNHLKAISDIFGVEITCDRKNGYRYRVVGELYDADKWMKNYLNKLLFQFSMLDDKNLKGAVYDIDNANDVDKSLYFILSCKKKRQVISFTYFKSLALINEKEPKRAATAMEVRYGNFAPLGIVHADRSWYVIGYDYDTDRIVPIQRCHMKDISITEGKEYNPVEQFSAEKYVESFFNLNIDSSHDNDDSAEFKGAIFLSSFVKCS